jgi:hypothetical protein
VRLQHRPHIARFIESFEQEAPRAFVLITVAQSFGSSKFYISSPGLGVGSPNRAQEGRNRAPLARGRLRFSEGAPVKWSPDWQAEVGQGAQVKALSYEFTPAPLTRTYLGGR